MLYKEEALWDQRHLNSKTLVLESWENPLPSLSSSFLFFKLWSKIYVRRYVWIYVAQSLALSRLSVDFISWGSIIINKMKLVELCQIIQSLSTERIKKLPACRSCLENLWATPVTDDCLTAHHSGKLLLSDNLHIWEETSNEFRECTWISINSKICLQCFDDLRF